MPYVKIHQPGGAIACNQIIQRIQRIREWAHSLFDRRVCVTGLALQDWLQIEHELLFRYRR